MNYRVTFNLHPTLHVRQHYNEGMTSTRQFSSRPSGHNIHVQIPVLALYIVNRNYFIVLLKNIFLQLPLPTSFLHANVFRGIPNSVWRRWHLSSLFCRQSDIF